MVLLSRCVWAWSALLYVVRCMVYAVCCTLAAVRWLLPVECSPLERCTLRRASYVAFWMPHVAHSAMVCVRADARKQTHAIVALQRCDTYEAAVVYSAVQCGGRLTMDADSSAAAVRQAQPAKPASHSDPFRAKLTLQWAPHLAAAAHASAKPTAAYAYRTSASIAAASLWPLGAASDSPSRRIKTAASAVPPSAKPPERHSAQSSTSPRSHGAPALCRFGDSEAARGSKFARGCAISRTVSSACARYHSTDTCGPCATYGTPRSATNRSPPAQRSCTMMHAIGCRIVCRLSAVMACAVPSALLVPATPRRSAPVCPWVATASGTDQR